MPIVTLGVKDDVTLVLDDDSSVEILRLSRLNGRMRVRPLNGWKASWSPDGSVLCEPPATGKEDR